MQKLHTTISKPRLALLAALLVASSFTQVAQADEIINPTGGGSLTSDLKITILPTTRFQITRRGSKQFYGPEGLHLAVGSAVFGEHVSSATAWIPVSQSPISGDGTVATPWTVVTKVRNATGFSVAMTIRYAADDENLAIKIVVTPPATNTEAVKLYHLADTYLSGGDTGAAYWQPNSDSNPPPTTPRVVGVTKTIATTRQYEAFVAGEPLWDHYYSARYTGLFTSPISTGGDLSGALNTNVNTDNGVGVQWTLGPITTPRTINYVMAFSTATSDPVCGDGTRTALEACDDGNVVNGDGCDALCQEEPGYECTSSGCNTLCGDGLVAGAEACDDGNLVGLDGCSGTCVVESGYQCTGAPSVCQSTCGDGVIASDEACDDNGLIANDGCSAVCAVEVGWSCMNEPSECTTGCGDGIRAGAEACDDGNVMDGDGCDASCSVEPGYDCNGNSPSVCQSTCGDGQLANVEECDDGNLAAGDGCNAVCGLEAGWECLGSPSLCTGLCGDGLVVDQELCDDGNLLLSDGCTSACVPELGWTCDNSEPSNCLAVCGDGLRLGDERCDDGNFNNGDGCSATCRPEEGFVCPSAGDCLADTDFDTVADISDNCPTVPNLSQADSDGDGVGDACTDLPDLEPRLEGGGGCQSTSGRGSAPGLLLLAMILGAGFRRRKRS